MSTRPGFGNQPPTKGEQTGHWWRGFAAPGALLTVFVFALLSWASWVGVGTVCVNSTELHRGTPQGLVCEIELGHWHGSAVGGQTALERGQEYLMLALPVLIVLGGIGLAASRHRRRPFWLALIVAFVVLLAPWIGLIVPAG
jgi:hypothetical protein